MAKTSGLGDALFIGGNDLSGDFTAIGNVGGGPAALTTTGIDKGAMERIGGARDGRLEATAWFNPTLSHPVLAALPTADVQSMYCRGTTLGSPAATIVGKQANYDGTRGQDGAFTFAVSMQANGFGVEWGYLLTAGKRVDVAATNGTGVDFGLGSSPLFNGQALFGAQCYLQVFAFTGTDVTIKVQDSADNATFADVAGMTFTAVTSGPGVQRIATASGQTVRRYLRAVTTTVGGFTSCTFAVAAVRNDVSTVF
ncbi:hypothetical protein ACFXKC_46215 [Streptomyces sp. NPDC059340]|uniref:hypothetical protein n=1 Tax=Streptomyces sp. NPDC059340 TaxID=3346806 RepID=UPI0036950BC3